jgi:hypothetical protein
VELKNNKTVAGLVSTLNLFHDFSTDSVCVDELRVITPSKIDTAEETSTCWGSSSLGDTPLVPVLHDKK